MDRQKMETTVQKKANLQSTMGRPRKGCLSSFLPIVSERIVSIRKKHPGWGADTILADLQLDTSLKGIALPRPNTIALFLKSKGLVKKYEKNIPLPESQLHPATSVHHIWQIDGQGATSVEGIGKVHLINTKDVFSRTYCGSVPQPAGLHSGAPSGAMYQHALRLAFCEFGMPTSIQTDHASVFYENKGKSPFPTRFHLWLISLGIPLIFSRKYIPTDQAIVERSHQTLTNQVIKGSTFESLLALHSYCDARRTLLNEVLPCSTIGGVAPLEAYPKARFSGKEYHPHLEKQIIDLDKVYQYLSKGKWFRKAGKNRALHLGGQYYYIKAAQKQSLVQIQFDLKEKLLVFRDVNEHFLDKQPIKELSIEILMGASFFEATLPDFQLKLPFVWEDQLISTTFLNSA